MTSGTHSVLALIPMGCVLLAACQSAHLPADTRADSVVILKAKHRLSLVVNGRVAKSYRVALGWSPVGPKLREDDGKTPEGTYRVADTLPDSRYHRALLLSYPHEADRAAAARLGASPGGGIMIHGLGKCWHGPSWLQPLHVRRDWTQGCIAVTDVEAEEIYRAVTLHTPVEIRP